MGRGGGVGGLLTGHVSHVSLHAAASSNDGEIFVLPAKLGTSAVDVVEASTNGWVRAPWDNLKKKYNIEPADGEQEAPDWRFSNFKELVELAFAGRILNDPEQPEVKAILAKKAVKR